MRLGQTNSSLFLVTATLLMSATLVLTLGGCPGATPDPGGSDNLAFGRHVVETASPGGPVGPAAAVAADFDGDGKPDLVSAWKTSGQVRLYLQKQVDGATTWEGVTLASGSIAAGVQAVAVGDLNGDGRLDVVAATSQGRLLYLRQLGADSGNASNWEASVIGASQRNGFDSWSDVQVVNVDGDSQLEVVATLESQDGRVCIFDPPAQLANGDGWVRVDVAVNGRNGAAQVLAIDMDGDADVDLLTIARNEGSDSVAWHANPGPAVALTNAWVRHSIGSVQDPRSVALAYIDADDFFDIVVSSGDGHGLWGFQAPTNATDLLDATKRWAPHQIANFGTDKGSGVCAADFDADGVVEIVAGTTGTGKLSLYKWNGLTGLWAEKALDASSGNYGRCLVADLDQDNVPDVVSTTDVVTGGQVVWYSRE